MSHLGAMTHLMNAHRSVLLMAGLAVALHGTPASADHHQPNDSEAGWISLFNGQNLEGWKVAENPDTFKVVDGVLVVHGPRAHAFYVGDVENADFENFEWRCEIMTKPNANSGMYFHTEYQEEGWPEKGYEVQVNCSQSDPRKTGSLYAIKDVMNEAPHEDNKWFTQTVRVEGNRIVIRVNNEVVIDYTEPENPGRSGQHAGKLLSSGTFAIQGHDPDSEVHYRKIMVKPLP